VRVRNMATTITTNMRQFFSDNPDLKFIFFGGKGGVGKTVMAGATALWLAGQGHRTLLASTNPVHSLSGLLGRNVFGRITPLPEAPQACAYEIDTRDTIDRSKKDIRDKINWFLRFADLQVKADEFVDAATLNPAFEESAMFENMLDLMFGGEFDTYVFDTAPTANARRLLGMSQVYSLWVDKMMKSREEATSLRQLLSFSKKKEEADPLMDYLVDFRKRMEHARQLLTDPALTAFFFVTLPEALPIAVITRFLKWFHDFGIPVGGIVVNGLIPHDPTHEPEFIANRRAMQAEHLETIWRLFDGQVRALVPLYDDEVRGTAALNRLAEALFGS
jgi:arsenite-transporting ATPase